MLKSIEYTAQFATTGRVLNEKIKFQRGFGVITGPNEAGKSFVLEMVRWILFGTAALRGPTSGYTKLHGALEFVVRGEEYFLTRASNGATLRKGRERNDIAVGTKPVNAKVVEVLGFGLPVFDIACVANQNALLALGEMRPADRKRLVDSVIGLGIIEDLGKLAGDEANAKRRAYEEISSALSAPVKPEEPEDYVPSSTLAQTISTYAGYKQELDQISGWLSAERKPVNLPQTDIPLPSSELEDMVENQNQLRAREQELASFPKPRYTVEELDQMRNQNAGFENKKRLKSLQERVVHLDKDHIECPECGHSWSLDQQTIDQIRAEIEKLEKENVFSDAPAELPDMYLDRELSKIKKWPGEEELTNIRSALARQPDFRIMLAKRQKYELALASYADELAAYEEWQKEKWAKEARADFLAGAMEGAADLNRQYDIAREYETHVAFYDKVKTQYDERMKTVNEIKLEAEDWQKARVALVELRSKVKQHLVPSLNKVASHLLKEMTGGQRQTIVIDEEFNITVDSQPLDTLSGSGMAVANLAVRLGLGQVLTNGIFSVFMADEIDASMDTVRAESTVNSLKNLRTTISQILLVTHKSPTADYHIVLGENNE